MSLRYFSTSVSSIVSTFRCRQSITNRVVQRTAKGLILAHFSGPRGWSGAHARPRKPTKDLTIVFKVLTHKELTRPAIRETSAEVSKLAEHLFSVDSQLLPITANGIVDFLMASSKSTTLSCVLGSSTAMDSHRLHRSSGFGERSALCAMCIVQQHQ